MPTISRFFGITARMNYRSREHNPPHIHFSYGDQECVVSLNELKTIAGQIPPKAEELALRWTRIHQKELLNMWSTQNFKTLPPLD